MHISSTYAKILGENFFAHGRFPEVGQKQKTEKKRRRKKRERDRKLVITMVRYALEMPPGVAHGSHLDQV